MTNEDDRKGVAAELRRQAEERARTAAATSPEGLASPESPEVLEDLSPEAARRTLHELRVHQIELEMQNEELRRAQAERDAVMARYFDLYDLAPVGYCTVSERGLILEANLTAADLLGVARSALVRQPIFRFILGDDQDSFYHLRKPLFETGAPQATELRMVKRDGTVFWAHLAATAARGEGGTPVGRLVLHDVTERKQADLELQESKRLVESVLENVPLMVFLKDAESLRFVMFNRAGEDLLGCAREDLLGKNDEDLFPPGQAAFFMAKDREVLAGDLLLDIPEEPIQTVNRGTRLLHTRKVCVKGADGVAKYLLGISDDITERRRAEAARASLEEQLRESHKMEAIGTLAGGIAHDFNNVLATILGNVELARQDLGASPLALESLEEIRRAGSRARDLVQQILSFSRRQPTERRPTAVAPIVEATVRLLRATLPARLALEVHVDTEAPPVLADATQVKQVLINLVTNAMQAIRVGPGRIGIRLDTVTLDAALAGSHPALGAMLERHPGPVVLLAVSDDGEGMDAATLGKAFEPFFTTRAVGEGTGLGLAVVHGIVQGHEGAIVVKSEPGKGSTFTVFLPAAEVLDDRAAQAGPPGAEWSAEAGIAEPGGAGGVEAGGARHILYLDDDESLVFLVERLLKRRGFRVSTFTNQRAALEALRADPALFDLVVTDYNMPGMSGLDVARAARAIRADLPVAVASGFVDEALREQAGAAGVRELVFKAGAAEDLCDSLARLARSLGEGSTAVSL